MGAAVGLSSLVAVAPTVHAGDIPVCTAQTNQRHLLARSGDPASDRILTMVEGNIPHFAVGIALDAMLRGEVESRQADIMRSVARELDIVSNDPAEPASSD